MCDEFGDLMLFSSEAKAIKFAVEFYDLQGDELDYLQVRRSHLQD